MLTSSSIRLCQTDGYIKADMLYSRLLAKTKLGVKKVEIFTSFLIRLLLTEYSYSFILRKAH